MLKFLGFRRGAQKTKKMGGLCSTPTGAQTTNPYAGSRNTGLDKQYEQQERQRQRQVQREASRNRIVARQPVVQEPMVEKPVAEEKKESPRLSARYSNASDDEFYDGIPRYQKSSSYLKSRSLRATKVGFLVVCCVFVCVFCITEWRRFCVFLGGFVMVVNAELSASSCFLGCGCRNWFLV